MNMVRVQLTSTIIRANKPERKLAHVMHSGIPPADRPYPTQRKRPIQLHPAREPQDVATGSSFLEWTILNVTDLLSALERISREY